MEPGITEKGGRTGADADRDGIAELAELILGERLGAIDQLRGRVTDSDQRREVLKADLREVMGELVEGEGGEELGEIVRPLVEGGLRASVERGGGAVEGALAPVMGGAVLRQLDPFAEHLLLAVDEKIKVACGPRRLRRRLGGRGWEEVLRRAGSSYRVEEVGLFVRGDLAPLCVVGREGAEGLLAAGLGQIGEEGGELREAARRSLGGQGGGVGQEGGGRGGSVFCVEGVRTVLAARIGGVPGVEVRRRLAALAARLDGLAGEAGGVGELGREGERGDEVRLALCEEGLIESDEGARVRRAGGWVWWLLLLAGPALLGGLWWWGTEAHRWGRFVAELGEQPGIVVLADKRGREVVGLREVGSQARDPGEVAREHGYGEVRLRFVEVAMGGETIRPAAGAGGSEVDPAEDGAADGVAEDAAGNDPGRPVDPVRAEVLELVPDLPEDVELRVEDGILRVRGGLEEPAFGQLVELAPALGQVDYIDATGLRDLTREKIKAVQEQLGEVRVWFRAGSAELDEGAGAALDGLVGLLAELDGEAAKKGLRFRIVPRVFAAEEGGPGRELLGECLDVLARELGVRGVGAERLGEAEVIEEPGLAPGRWGIGFGLEEG